MPTRNQTAGRFVVVEGPNGAGKSRVARHLADSMGARIIRFPEPFLDFRARHQLDEVIEPLPRLAYYLAGIAHLSGEIAAGAGSIVCDRYFASPLALMLAEGSLGEEDLLEVSGPILDRLVIPEVTLLLTADPDVLRQRLEDRADSRNGSSMRLTMASSQFTTNWMSHLRQIITARGPMIEIDTTNLDPGSMCRAAMDALANPVVAQ